MPQGISIPNLFETYNEAHIYSTLDRLANNYERLTKNYGDPANCVECGQCEEACPQHLLIREHLKQIREKLGNR